MIRLKLVHVRFMLESMLGSKGESLRICTACGNLIQEGYYLNGDYACSEKCFDSLEWVTGLSYEQYLREYSDDDDFYWTDWSEEYGKKELNGIIGSLVELGLDWREGSNDEDKYIPDDISKKLLDFMEEEL